MKFKVSFLLGFIFFIFGLFTLPHYGINWDTINHLPRGQAYLHYFLTGKKDYSDLEPYKKYFQNPNKLIPAKDAGSRSYYQNDAVTFNFFMEYDGDGHPPLSDIFSSVFNRILFGKLKLVNDIDSYRVYGVLLASITVGLIYYWVSSLYGNFAGIISAISLATYPLFWSESHFNGEKDIPETALWTLFIFYFYKAITRKNWKLVFVSALVFGLALGTKFNIIFSFLVVIPWLIFYLKKNPGFLAKNYRLILSLTVIPIIGFLILVGTWPYIWQDFLYGISRVFGFYKTIGTTSAGQGAFRGPLGINLYPVIWIALTTPPIVLFFGVLGILKALSNLRREKDLVSLIFILWFFVPIMRVIAPKTVIYGGVRQIMEYIPALAVFSGLGAYLFLENLRKILRKLKILKLISVEIAILLLVFFSLIYNLVRLHPNENAYFNFLVGGLRGAKEKNIPSWGNTFGAAYRQGFSWINKNAPENSNLVFAFELMPNAPNIWVRPDIFFHNSQRSGFLRKGEYAITLTYQGTAGRSYYDTYLETTLNPVYESKVDEVSVVKVWKNDEDHAKGEFKKILNISNVKFNIKKDSQIDIDLGSLYSLAYFDLSFAKYKNCEILKEGKVSISSEGGIKWLTMTDALPTGQISIFGQLPTEDRLVYSFVGQNARYISISFSPENSCLKSITKIGVYELPDMNKKNEK